MSSFHGVMVFDGTEIIACCSGDGDFAMMPDASSSPVQRRRTNEL